jgi:hypothetical protein
MRVARAVRNRKTGNVEKYEEFREPTERERAVLAQQGVFPAQAAAAPAAHAPPPAPMPLVAPQLAGAAGSGSASGNAPPAETPWLKLAIAAGVGAAALWAAQRYVMPMLSKSDGPDAEGDDEAPEGED